MLLCCEGKSASGYISVTPEMICLTKEEDMYRGKLTRCYTVVY
jgi:hypothetical protein